MASDRGYEWNATRGATGSRFYLIPPAARAPSRLAEVGAETTVCKFVTPRHAPARFAEYLVELEPGGRTQWPVAGGFEHFVSVLDGTVKTLVDGLPQTMTPGTFIYLPDDQDLVLDNDSDALCRVIWIKRRYQPLPGFGRPPAVFDDSATFAEEEWPCGLWRRELLPANDPRRDFTMSIMRFEANGALGVVEMHEEERGLYMTAGGGTYLLDATELSVEHEDFIYMAPYCPQGFHAGPEGAEYLLYKDVMRDGFLAASDLDHQER
ncbi:MAG: cupin domain-containing protein [Actinomycetota bacterium]|nr:cupin domain-containing protein [Actinomycetota bacterium]